MVDRMRRQEREQRQRAGLEPNGPAQNGAFPPAGDAARGDWAVAR